MEMKFNIHIPSLLSELNMKEINFICCCAVKSHFVDCSMKSLVYEIEYEFEPL